MAGPLSPIGGAVTSNGFTQAAGGAMTNLSAASAGKANRQANKAITTRGMKSSTALAPR